MANKGGRPTKLNDELKDQICKVVRAGNYIETAAAYAGLSKQTLYDWMKRGRRESEARNEGKSGIRKEEKYVRFLDAIEKALADGEIRDVAIVAQAATENWQAAAWKLERRNPGRWGRVRHEITGKDGGPVEVKTWAELAARAAEGSE